VIKKIVLGVLMLFVVCGVGVFFWAKSVFGGDGVRTQLAAQLSKALGEPVTVGSVSASIYPRVTVTLGDVKIGDKGEINVQALDLGTDFRALLSRRIEHAAMHLNGARIALPLPKFAGLTSSGASSSGSSPSVQLVSIDEVTLSGVEITSGGRMLRGDIEVVPHGTNAATIRKIALTADDTSIQVTGEISDLAAPAAELTLTAGTLNVDKLLAFVNDFSAGSGEARVAASPTAPAPGHANVKVTMTADRSTIGAMAIEKLQATALLKNDTVSLVPLTFNVFGGSYNGSLAVDLGDEAPAFHWKARMSNVDVAAATAFAGSPNTISGRFNGEIDLTGSGADAASAMRTVQGTAHMNISNGVVRDLGLIRTIVAATSLNSGAIQGSASRSKDEPFTKLGGTVAIGNGTATTNDLSFESPDLLLSATGSSKLDGSSINFAGKVQLSEELSKLAGGGSLTRAVQDNGRLTLPATISGSAYSPLVHIDTGSMAKTAAKNVATQETTKLLEKKGFGSFLKH